MDVTKHIFPSFIIFHGLLSSVMDVIKHNHIVSWEIQNCCSLFFDIV